MNGSSCPSPFNPTAAKIGKTVAYCLIFVASLVGNSFIGIVVYKTRTLRRPINYFIVNMAMSNLLYPIFLIPLDLTEMFVESWLIGGFFGLALCKLLRFLADISIIVSIQSLVLIAVDRFEAVVFPLRSPLVSSKRCPLFILATWIVAIAVLSPYLSIFKLVENQVNLECLACWNEAFGESSSLSNYFLALYVVFLYAPTALLVVLYSIIVVKLKSQIFPGDQQSFNVEQQRAKRNRNVLKMAIAIVVGLVLCWVPWSISNLLTLFAWEWNRTLPCGIYLYHDIAFFISLLSFAINPCICFTFSGNYRQGLKRLLKCFNVVGVANGPSKTAGLAKK